MRGFLFGLVVIVGLSVTVLSLRPGGIRRQLRFAARRFKLVLILGAVYVVGSAIIRVAFPSGPGSDYGPPALAGVLAIVFVVLGQDPVEPTPRQAEALEKGRR
jgi:hypothetical protein